MVPLVTFALLVAVFSHIGHSTSSFNCSFPDFLQNDVDDDNDYWHLHRKLNGEEIRLRFQNGNLWATSSFWENMGDIVMDSECVGVHDGDVFAVEADEIVKNSTMCMQFVQQTDNVVLIRGGLPTEDSNCTGSTLSDILWPLVASRPRGSASLPECPLSAGYLFTAVQTIYEDAEKKEKDLCPDHPLPSQMEVDCMKGEGIMLNFPSPLCVPQFTGWAQEQQLICLDSWADENNNTFVILANKYYEPLHCMRYNETDATIFLDLACWEDDTVASVHLNLTRRHDFGECKDDLPACDDKYCSHHLYPDMCQSTCDICEKKEEGCEFDDQKKGTWSLQQDTYSDTVTIDTDKLNISRYAAMACYEKVNDNTMVLKSTDHKNGCRPRYSCVRFDEKSPAVLQYQLGQCQGHYSSARELCASENFVNDPQPFRDIYHSRYMKTLIATEEEKLSATVPCGFRGNFSLLADHGQDVNCTGMMGDVDDQCNSTDSVSVNLDCKNGPYVRDLTCLATMQTGTHKPAMLLTLDKQNAKGETPQAQCWILENIVGMNPLSFYIMRSSQCAEDTLEQIAMGVREPQAHGFAIRNDSCDGVPTTDHTTVTTPTPPSSSPHTSTTTTTTTTNEILTTVEDAPPHHTHTAGIVVGVILLGIVVGVVGFFAFRYYRATKTPYRVL